MRPTAAILTFAVAALWTEAAFSFRPLDGTDASVAEFGSLETELGPAQYLREGPNQTLIVPQVRFNYGFAPGWETTLEGQVEKGLSGEARGTSLLENAALIKAVLREGVLQDKPGASIAIEPGVLLPGINGQHGVGATFGLIVSQRWHEITIHWNAVGNLTQDHHGEIFLDAIFEGPRDWTVRPVAEVFYERGFGEFHTTSGLIGAIWQVNQDLAADFGVREASFNGRPVTEIRAGVTFALPIIRPERR
jgi:hypothetical protein